jgi:hypothetical protein
MEIVANAKSECEALSAAVPEASSFFANETDVLESE